MDVPRVAVKFALTVFAILMVVVLIVATINIASYSAKTPVSAPISHVDPDPGVINGNNLNSAEALESKLKSIDGQLVDCKFKKIQPPGISYDVTPNIGLYLPHIGATGWAQMMNINFRIIDLAISNCLEKPKHVR